MARYWRCRKVTRGVRCGTLMLGTRKKCTACGTLRPAKRKPAHRAVLDTMPYEAWTDLYGEVCGICGRPPKPGRKLHRDHDHRSGLPRGVLCFPCNAGLRVYMDLAWLRSAVAYLERAERQDVAA